MGQFLWPLVILLLGLALTSAAWRYAIAAGAERSRAEFNLHARDATRNVQNRMEVYFGVLRSAGAFFAGSNEVTRTEWNTFVDFIRPRENYPGIEGMGVIRRITEGQKSKFENTVRREIGNSHTGYAIRPPGARENYFPVMYFWPPLAHVDPLGLDHGAYPEGLKMLESARDSGMVTVSNGLPYAKGSDRKSPFMIIYPIYRNGLPRSTVDERRKDLWGFVYARVNTNELFRDAIGPSVTGEIYLEIFEGGSLGQEQPALDKALLIFDADTSAIPHALDASYKPRHRATQRIGVDGTTWLFYTASKPGGVFERRDDVPLLTLLVGSLLSIGASHSFFVRDRQKRLTHHHAYHDSLTNLPNRMLLQDRFQQALANAQRHGAKIAMLFLDLDNFKPVNDLRGHAAGDKVLKAVAACLASCLREGDTLSRIGGDEFVILLLNITREEEASAVAQKIIDTISRLVPIAGEDVHLGGSVGISMFPQNGASFEELLKNADAAMYLAKEAGRNGFQFCVG